MAALARMANREHIIRIGEGDTVLLASSVIPGNENSIYRVINGLTRWGANVVHKANAKVHVSGHASAGELVYCYNVMRPTNVMPVHGEWRHLTANADLAVRTGISKDRVLVVEDGIVVDLVDGRATVVGRVPADYVLVDGMTVGGDAAEAMEDRRLLAEDGAITILGILNIETGRLSEPVEFISRGFNHDAGWAANAAQVIDEAMVAATRNNALDGAALERIFSESVTRWMQRKYRRNPVITAVVVDA